MTSYFELFITFARLGCMTFGGGLAMLPLLQREVVEKKGWATEEELINYYAVGQCTPGVIAVNTSTFIGHKLRGIPGGIIATLGFVFPSFLIIGIIAMVFQNFADLPIVQKAFCGIRVSVCVLIFNTVIRFYKKAVVDIFTLMIMVVVLVISVFTDISPVLFVVLAAILGIILTLTGVRKNDTSKTVL